MKKSLISSFETIVTGVLLAILIMVFVGQSLNISGDSMHPTLKDGERIIVEKVTYKSRKPQRGEVVVFRSQENDRIFLIKRIIALPGDTIGLQNGKITVNGIVQTEDYLTTKMEFKDLGVLEKYSISPIPEEEYVVMGDNRKVSYDSRIFGPVPFKKLVGKAFLVYWPLQEIRKI